MQAHSFKLSGRKSSLEELRAALRAEPQAAQINLADLIPEPDAGSEKPIRVRQVEVSEAIFNFGIHIPAGVAAHLLYDWLKAWLKSRADAAQVRVQEVQDTSAQSRKSE
jgi:hypothetical protein